MSGRHFDSTENAELRAKIDEAKRRLPLPELMKQLGFGEHAKKEAHCPWHSDEHSSFSVFKKKDGTWWHRCFVGCSQGDEIAFLVKHFDISRSEAIKRYLEMAGFPTRATNIQSRSNESREYPESLGSHGSLSIPESPCVSCVSVSPVSKGQGLDKELEKELKDLSEPNACTRAGDRAGRKRFKLARDVRAVEKRIGRELTISELMPVFDEWHRLSLPFLDSAKTRDDYLAAFLAELEKVRVPTGEGALTKALENVSKLSLDQLPLIPGYANAPEKSRRLAALHQELSRLSANGTYFLSYRDAAKVSEGLSHQEAHTITFALARLGVIEIVRKGKAGLNGGEAAEFRYLLAQSENREAEIVA
jgi:hypothetical protein